MLLMILYRQRPVESVHHAINLFPRYQTGTLELPRGVFMPRTPHKILVIKIQRRVVPAAIAPVGAEHPPGGVKLTGRETEPANEHHRDTAGPRQPGQSAAQTDKEAGMPEQVHPLLQGISAGKIFCSPRDVIPHESLSIVGMPVDTQHPVTLRFQVSYYFAPAGTVIPELRLAGGLGGDEVVN